MTEGRHQRLERLFLELLTLPVAERAAALDARCAGDPELRAELGRLLERDARTGEASLRPIVSFEADAAPPRAIGPYRLGPKLGEGGFGEVFEAEQTTPIRRQVAIKLLRPGLDTRAVLARFEAERHALALMDHPGIARVLDAGETEAGRPFVVMELVRGEPITQFCDRHALGTRERTRLMAPICRAVEHAHQKGVIHRDLKPSNLLVTMVDGKPLAKVIDFGIAKATHGPLAGATLGAGFGETVGTPEFASPEQLESGGADVDTRTDVYSLGVVLYRLLTGRLPLDSETLRRAGPAEAARILRQRALPRPSDVAGAAGSSVPPGVFRELRGDLDWIVLKALDPERDRRYASAAALADDLERHHRDEPVLAGPPGAGYRLGKLMRRHRAGVVGAAAVLLALLAGLATTTWQALRAQRASENAAAVNAFLTRMIAGANPEDNPGGREATVREVVDRAAAELDARATDNPDVEAGVRHAIGSTYMGLGLYEQAEAQLERAAGIHARRGTTPPRERIATRLAIADLENRRGRYARADSMLLDLSRQEPTLASDPATWIRYLHLRGGILGNLSRNAEADSLYGVAIALARNTPGIGFAPLVAALGELAGVRGSLGRQEEAVSLAREALDITRRHHPEDHHDVAIAVSRLAELLHQGGDYAAAESLHRVALGIDQRVLGPDHPIVAVRLSNLAWVLTDAGSLEEAVTAHRKAVALHVVTLGEAHPTVAIARGHLATVLQLRGELDEALTLRRAALEALRRHFGGAHEEVANAYNNLASVYRLMHRYREAIAAFREAIPIFEGLYGPVHPTLAICRHNLGKTLGDLGDHAAAEPVLREALAIARQVFPAGHVNLAFFDVTYGRTLVALGRHDEAERTLRAAHAKILSTLGADHPRTLEVATALVRYEKPGRRLDRVR